MECHGTGLRSSAWNDYRSARSHCPCYWFVLCLVYICNRFLLLLCPFGPLFLPLLTASSPPTSPVPPHPLPALIPHPVLSASCLSFPLLLLSPFPPLYLVSPLPFASPPLPSLPPSSFTCLSHSASISSYPPHFTDNINQVSYATSRSKKRFCRAYFPPCASQPCSSVPLSLSSSESLSVSFLHCRKPRGWELPFARLGDAVKLLLCYVQ